MIKLSERLSKSVLEELKLNDSDKTSFTEEELNSIKNLHITKDDLDVLPSFKNLVSLELELFPSINDEDLKRIGKMVPGLISLKIKEQNDLYNLDFENYESLEELCIIHNDNVIDFTNLKKLSRFTFYDNKEYDNDKQLVDYLIIIKDARVVLDIVYFVSTVRNLCYKKEDTKLLDKFSWVESKGIRKFYVYEYTSDQIEFLISSISDICSKYLYEKDSELAKFSILYRWMIDNFEFLNEDESDFVKEDYGNSYKSFTYKRAGRLSYAKAFQLLLTYADIKAKIVYSYGALDFLGYYNGEKIFSLMGDSDYALIRVMIDNKYYYCDIAWDSMAKKYANFNDLRLFLVSKEEVKLRHKFVGEGNVLDNYAYGHDEIAEMDKYAIERIKEVNELFDGIEKIDSSIMGVELNKLMLSNDIEELKNLIEDYDDDPRPEDVSKLEKLRERLESQVLELKRLEKNRRQLIEANGIKLKDNYLGEKVNVDDIMSVLKAKTRYFLLSPYMYRILVQLV